MSILSSDFISPNDNYKITNSLRFRRSASTYLNRTPSVAGNRRTWTYSGWVKLPATGTGSSVSLMIAGTGSASPNHYSYFYFGDSTYFTFNEYTAGTNDSLIQSTQVFRDPSAWQHVVVAYDTTQATTSNRVKIYINGTQVTSFSTASYPAQNYQSYINSTDVNGLGGVSWYTGSADGYTSDVYFIDGAALYPTYFGKFDANGVWVPIKYVGTNDIPLSFAADCTTGATVTISGDLTQDGAGPVSYAIDNNTGTEQRTSNAFTANTSRIMIDLGAGVTKNIRQISTTQSTGYIWTAGKLQYSDNGTSWTDAGSYAPANSTSTQYFTFPNNGAHRYWALMPTANAYGGAGYGLRFNEIELMEAATSNNYGPNGCHLEFKNAAALGTDTSGTQRYATFDPSVTTNGTMTFSNGYLTAAYGGSSNPTRWALSDTYVDVTNSNGYYVEFSTTFNSALAIGIIPYAQRFSASSLTSASGGAAWYSFSGAFYSNGSTSGYTAVTFASGDTIGVFVRGGSVWFRKNDTWVNGSNPDTNTNPAVTGLTGNYLIGVEAAGSGQTFTSTVNFGASAYSYSAPTNAQAFKGANHFVPVNFASTDQMVDTPTNNYCTLNPLVKGTALVDGNLKINTVGDNMYVGTQTFPTNGKTYFELTLLGTANNQTGFGLTANPNVVHTAYNVSDAYTYWLYINPGAQGNNCINTAGSPNIAGAFSGYTTAVNDVWGCAYDDTTGNVYVLINGLWRWYSGGWQSSATFAGASPLFTVSSTNRALGMLPLVQGSQGYLKANFGQSTFTYTPPTGFKALCTANLPAVAITKPKNYHNEILYTGNGSTLTVSGVGFAPDLAWLKKRSSTGNPIIYDSVRGAGYGLNTSSTVAEYNSATLLSSFTTDGFTLGSDTDGNANGATNVAWCWKAGGAAVSNTAGSITSSVSVNTTAGFSIVSFTGTGSNATVGHGLGAAPKLIILKIRNPSGSYYWMVYHASTGATGATYLNTTLAFAADASYWNNTAPTSTVFSIGASAAVNDSGRTIIAYCFAEIPGYSKFGSYVGNANADGPFVHCGFRPRFIMLKCSSNAGTSWLMLDTVRDTYNPLSSLLDANVSNAESSNYNGPELDVTATGFKLRNNSGADGGNINGSGYTYIFAAFAEYPFGGSNVAPSPAR